MVKVLFLLLFIFNIYLFMMISIPAKAELWRVTCEIPSRIVQVSESIRGSLKEAQTQSQNSTIASK